MTNEINPNTQLNQVIHSVSGSLNILTWVGIAALALVVILILSISTVYLIRLILKVKSEIRTMPEKKAKIAKIEKPKLTKIQRDAIWFQQSTQKIMSKLSPEQLEEVKKTLGANK